MVRANSLSMIQGSAAVPEPARPEAAWAGTAESNRQAVIARAASREEKRDSFIKNNSFFCA